MYFKSVSIYFVFNIFSALVPILAMPFLTHYLTPTDYGIFTTFTVIAMFIGTIYRLELNMSLKREYVDNPSDFSKFVSTAFVFSSIMLVPYCIIVLLIMPFVDGLYGIPLYWVFLMVVLAFVRSQTINLHHLWQITNKALPYGIWGLVTVLTVYIVVIMMVLFVLPSWEARAWGEWIIGVASFPIVVYYLRKDFSLKWRFDKEVLTKMFGYSLPLLPTTLLAYFFMVSDRIFITEFNGLYVLGLYAVALQLAASADLIFKAFLPVWEAWIYNQLGVINKKAVDLILQKLLILSLLCGLLMLLLPQVLEIILPYLTDKSFASAKEFLLPCLLSVICAGFFRLTKAPLVFMRKTSTVAYINFTMVVVNCVCMYIFVNEWGAAGAAYALALTFAYGSLLQIVFMIKYQEV